MSLIEHFHRDRRIIYTVDASRCFDFVARVGPDTDERELFLGAMCETFGLDIQEDIREVPVAVLVCVGEKHPGLSASKEKAKNGPEIWPVHLCGHFWWHNWSIRNKPVTYTFTGYTMGELAQWLEEVACVVVVDETGLAGRYDFRFVTETAKDETLADGLRKLGLGFQLVRRKIDAVYVDDAGNMRRPPAENQPASCHGAGLPAPEDLGFPQL